MADIAGAWGIHLTFLYGETEHAAQLQQDGERLSGIYQGRVGTGEITGTITGDTVKFRTTLRHEASTLPYDFTGTIQGSTMSGDVKLGEFGVAKWTAQRR